MCEYVIEADSREFDTLKSKKYRKALKQAYFFVKFLFFYIVYLVIRGIMVAEVIIVRITTSKSKNSESFYITQSYTNAEGKSTSKTIRKLGTLAELSEQLHTDRDGVIEWANEPARLETLKYKSEKDDATVMIPFHFNRLMGKTTKRSVL